MAHRFGLRRIAAGLLAMAGALVGLLFVVLPALGASTPTTVPPASTPGGVTPTKFSLSKNSDCKTFYPSGGGPKYSFFIKDGTSKTYTDPATGATFTLTLNPPNSGYPGGSTWPMYATNTYFSFTSTGAAIVDVGADGANESSGTHYSYSKLTGGYTTADGYLHETVVATDKNGNPTKLDGLDDMTFCYNAGGTASGTVFADANHNGKQDSGESGQSGWTVDLYSGSTGGTSPTATATSGTGGSYSFKNLTIGGTYTVCLVKQAGFLPTVPTGATNCNSSNEDPIGYTFTVSPNATGLNFGNVGGATISGSVFIDNNGNGTNDNGDSAGSGLTVTLYDTTTNSSTTMPTDSSGNFSFAGQFVGDNYKVCTTVPGGGNGYTETAPPSGPACGSGQAPIGYTISSLTTSGSSGNTFGLEPNGSISGTVYNDQNQDGANDSGDSALAWTVDLYAGSTKVASTTADSTSGNYSFALPLSAGTQYTVCEEPQGTYAQSEPLPSTDDIPLCQATGEPKGYQFKAGGPSENHPSNDFGNVLAQSGSSGSFNSTSQDGTVQYQADLGTGKNNNFVVSAGTTSDGHPYVRLWSGDSTESQVPMIETITWPYGSLDQNAFTLVYSDTFPFSDLAPMPYCLKDPGDVSGLSTPPPGVLPDGATSCLISTLIVAGQPFVAKVYSAVDGFRTTG